jgi:uncharacterized protein (UPF0248 family)
VLRVKYHPLRSLFNKIKWTEEKQEHYHFIIRYTYRGAPSDTREVCFSEVTHIGKNWFEIGEDDAPIPFHRILEVRDTRIKKILWRKRRTNSE